jgi:hypothetical protein
MPRVRLEPTTPLFERAKTVHTLNLEVPFHCKLYFSVDEKAYVTMHHIKGIGLP